MWRPPDAPPTRTAEHEGLAIASRSWCHAVKEAKNAILSQEGDSEEDALRAFRKFDADNSGSIDLSELTDVFKGIGLNFDANTVRRVFNEIDHNRDNQVSKGEFMMLLGHSDDIQRGSVSDVTANERDVEAPMARETDSLLTSSSSPPLPHGTSEPQRHADVADASAAGLDITPEPERKRLPTKSEALDADDATVRNICARSDLGRPDKEKVRALLRKTRREMSSPRSDGTVQQVVKILRAENERELKSSGSRATMAEGQPPLQIRDRA